MTRLDGLPFSIKWRSEDPMLIDNSGKIDRERLKEEEKYEEGVLAGLTATLIYRDHKEEISFFIKIYPKTLTVKEQFRERLKEILIENDDRTITEPVFYLPDMVENVPVKFEEIKKSDSPFIMILSFFTGIALIFAREKDKKKKEEDMIKEMNDEYPRIMNKFALYYNAGIPIKNIWNKICRQYNDQLLNGGRIKRIYEEMLISSRQMSEGKGEISAYEDFAVRCNLPKYRKFISLIEQTLAKGKSDMGILLQKEAQDAFEERKAIAKTAGEKAGTKLLLPMFMMLFIVLMMIMIPAFFSFRM